MSRWRRIRRRASRRGRGRVLTPENVGKLRERGVESPHGEYILVRLKVEIRCDVVPVINTLQFHSNLINNYSKVNVKLRELLCFKSESLGMSTRKSKSTKSESGSNSTPRLSKVFISHLWGAGRVCAIVGLLRAREEGSCFDNAGGGLRSYHWNGRSIDRGMRGSTRTAQAGQAARIRCRQTYLVCISRRSKSWAMWAYELAKQVHCDG